MGHIKAIVTGVIALAMLIIFTTGVSVNDNGYRTIVQYPNGTTFIQFQPGWYFTAWGMETIYSDVITFDFQEGMEVRYQDGGKGTVEGIARFGLPTDEAGMLSLHKAFRSEQGLRNKMLNTTVQEALNLSAGLMTSEEAYAEKRSLFGDLAKAQVASGKFKTRIESREITLADGTIQKTNIPVIVLASNGEPVHYKSDLAEYGISTTSFQVKEWNFEPKTLAFIDSKRDANMAIITAKAATKKAEQLKLQVIADGKKRVAAAQYKEEEKKITAEVQAERIKSVALIEASRETAKAKELTAAAKEETQRQRQLALAAKEQGRGIMYLADANAHAKRVSIEADDGFKARLDNDLAKTKVLASAIERMNVPQTMILGAQTSGGSGNMETLLQFKALELINSTNQLNKTKTNN